MSATLTPQQRLELKKAAYGAVTLVSMADPGMIATTKANFAGSKALTAATGLVGTILAGKDKFRLTGRTTAEIADEVFPALTSTVDLLAAQDTDEAETSAPPSPSPSTKPPTRPEDPAQPRPP